MPPSTSTRFHYASILSLGFRAVGDGSEKIQRHGSFGWVLSTLQGARGLAIGMGPARGQLPKLYHAEACGLLLFLRFRLGVKDFTYTMHAAWEGLLATASQGQDLHKQEVPVDLDRGEVVLDCLRPEWDILIEIQSGWKEECLESTSTCQRSHDSTP